MAARKRKARQSLIFVDTNTGVSLEQLNQQILAHLRPSTPSETNLDDGLR
jgi:hypothetical protein